jgi:hypothetical protein
VAETSKRVPDLEVDRALDVRDWARIPAYCPRTPVEGRFWRVSAGERDSPGDPAKISGKEV